jgi:regulator of sirC expression with transglutaminase-like and TPR domain
LEYYSDAAWREFQVQATAWRALSVKPVIKEDVRKHRLLAENAVKEKQFDSAVEEYEAGLQIDPVWPEGHFNAALLCAELGYYPEAIHHMRAYLELVPDAPDAQRARDQLMIWEARLTKRR